MSRKSKIRSDGRCYASGYYTDESGIKKRKYFYGSTQKEADEKKKVYEESLKPKPVDMSFSSWADKWMELYGQGSYSVLESNRIALNKLKKYFDNREINTIRKSDIKDFANSVSGLSFSSVNKIKSVTNRVFREAREDHLIEDNPTLNVRWDYASKGSHRALEHWERDLITQNWELHPAGLWCMIMLYAGLRRGELIALKWRDINLQSGVIHVTRGGHFEGNDLVIEDQPKSLAGIRDVPIVKPLAVCLEKCRTYAYKHVCTMNGGPITETSYNKAMSTFQHMLSDIMNDRDPKHTQAGRPHKRNLAKASSEEQLKAWSKKNLDVDIWEAMQEKIEFRSHDLRHTFCTMLFDADVDVKTAQYLMGHADSTMTLKVYDHLSKERTVRSIDKLRAYLDNGCQTNVNTPENPDK